MAITKKERRSERINATISKKGRRAMKKLCTKYNISQSELLENLILQAESNALNATKVR